MLSDLATIISNIHSKGDVIILSWDANKPIGDKDIIQFQAKTGLVSLMYQHQLQFSTYTRGTKIIDHIYGSPALVHKVSANGYIAILF
jgi:hypothetical protein